MEGVRKRERKRGRVRERENRTRTSERKDTPGFLAVIERGPRSLHGRDSKERV